MQMTVDGLLRTVLHDCLKQLPPSTAQRLLPERWEAATLFEEDDFPWSWEETPQALGTLITEVHPEIRFFLMIDGLDECSGNQTELIELITDLTDQAANLKCCLASRPWNNFEDAFGQCPSLRVQDLTAPDIAHFIDSKFRSNSGFLEFQVRAPSQAQKLVKDIAKKAEGVFLWVLLVVRSLLEGLTDGDSVDDLHERLEELPSTLEELYAKILKSLREKHLDHASRIFQIVRVDEARPLLLQIALADLEDGAKAMRAPVGPLSPEETSALCKSMKRKLMSRCRGLLEVSSPDDKSLEDPDLLDPYHGVVHGELSPAFEVQYLHTTVRDYIQSSDSWSWLLSANKEPFDPHLSLTKSHLLSLKMPWTKGPRGWREIIWMCITHAKPSLNSPSSQAAEQDEVLLLLDELDRTAASYCDGLSDCHWSTGRFLASTRTSSFAHLMAACGLHQYLEARLFVFDLMEEDAKGGMDVTTPLLITAIEGQLTVDFPHVGAYLDGPHEKVVATLLDKGADCHKLHDGRSAWDVAESQGNADILALFEKYCGPKPEHSADPRSFYSPSPPRSNVLPLPTGDIAEKQKYGTAKPGSERVSDRAPCPNRHPESKKQVRVQRGGDGCTRQGPVDVPRQGLLEVRKVDQGWRPDDLAPSRASLPPIPSPADTSSSPQASPPDHGSPPTSQVPHSQRGDGDGAAAPKSIRGSDDTTGSCGSWVGSVPEKSQDAGSADVPVVSRKFATRLALYARAYRRKRKAAQDVRFAEDSQTRSGAPRWSAWFRTGRDRPR